MVGHLDGVGLYCNWNQLHIIYACIGFYCMCWIGIWIMCAFEIWIEMLLLCNFHDGFDSQKHTFVMV
jgi:hypothetical protein